MKSIKINVLHNSITQFYYTILFVTTNKYTDIDLVRLDIHPVSQNDKLFKIQKKRVTKRNKKNE